MASVTFSLVIFILPLNFYFANGGKYSCGRPLGSEFILRTDRVVAGYDVGYYRYPWFAALLRYDQVVCGGTLIGPRTVVTAAHCYKEFLNLSESGNLKLEDIYTIRLGSYNICTTDKTSKDFKAQSVEIHELYKTKSPYYDICLITLRADAHGFMPICLPGDVVSKRPREGTVPGMGTLKYNGDMPCTLHEARILIYPDTTCRQMIDDTGNDPKEIKNAFCAGYLQGGIDTCQGDSGGPLQVMKENGDYVLLGVVSFGFKCAEPGLLGMYTDVSQYLDWIEDKSGLDAGIVDLIYGKNDSSSTSVTTARPSGGGAIGNGPGQNTPGPGPTKKKKRKHRRPYRRPIMIIILRGKHLVKIKKTVLHMPIDRN